MIIWWVFAGIVAGIGLADLFPSLMPGLFLLVAGIGLYALTGYKKGAIFIFFLAVGIIITVPRLNLLYEPGDYGKVQEYTVRTDRLVQAGAAPVWQGIIHQPEDLSGAIVQVRTEEYRPGVYTFSGCLFPPVQYRNPGQEWHYKRKIFSGEVGVLNHPDILNFTPIQPNFLESMRTKFRANIVSNLKNHDSASLALALTTGDRSLLTSELKSSVYATGVGHIMALSGLHVSILIGLIMNGLRKIGLTRVYAYALAVAFLLFFLVFAGPSPSLVRAVLMSVYGFSALLAGRENLGIPALLWTGFCMLMYNPLWLFDYAFVYSFLATYVCLAAEGRLEKYLAFLPDALRRTAALTLLIQLTALPLNLYLFGSISLWAPLANTIIVPLMPLMAGASFAAGLTTGWAGKVVSLPAEVLFSGVSAFLRLLNRFPLTLEMGGVYLVLGTGISSCILSYLSGVSKKVLVVILGICVLIVPVYTLWANCTRSVWFLDVGQGDSALIRIGRKWFLIDCGDSYAGERAVVPTMKFLGVDRLSAVIISHPHADHAGGLGAVLANYPVDMVLVNPAFLQSEWAENIPYLRIARADIAVDDHLQVFSHGLNLPDLNETSVLTSCDLHTVSVLFTGDIGQIGENFYKKNLGPHEILKVAHHGSNTSSSEQFLTSIQPKAAIISCGLGNRYGLPGVQTVARLEQFGTLVYRTDISGCVRLIVWPWGKSKIITFAGD